MATRSSITIVAASLASLLTIASAQATSTPNGNMPGQSARAGTQSQADMRAQYRQRGTVIPQDRYDMAPTGDWNMQDRYEMERADRPNRQR